MISRKCVALSVVDNTNHGKGYQLKFIGVSI